MKKSFFVLGSVPALITPLVVISSCSTTDKMTNFNAQYDLFTPELVNQENVSKNLAFSINNDIIGNIYSIPKNLDPSVNYSFLFSPSEDGKTLTLFVQIYDYNGRPVNYSDVSIAKEITVISGFRELTVAEQTDINLQYSNFKKLTLTGDTTILPSAINDFSQINGSASYAKDNSKYKYIFDLIPNNGDGKLTVKLRLTSLEDYPLSSSVALTQNTHTIQFMTFKDYQAEIDGLYSGANEIMNVNLSDTQYSKIDVFASSINNAADLLKFYNQLKAINKDINIPDFLSNPSEFKFLPNVQINTNDSTRNVTITVEFYDRKSGSILTPSPSVNKTKFISNFKQPSNELLKATMDAYKNYGNFKALKAKELQLPSMVVPNPQTPPALNTISDINPKFLAPFEVTVDKYPTPPTTFSSFFFRATTPTTETFKFRPTIAHVSNNDDSGIISYSIALEVEIGVGSWFVIRPPQSVNENNDKPSFSETKKDNFFDVGGFLTNELKKVNGIYMQIDTKIKALADLIVGEDKFMVKDISAADSQFDFYNIDFATVWASLYSPIENPTTDPLGIALDTNFRINYKFINSNGTQDNYNVTTSTIGNKIYKWVKIKASVHSAFSDFEYEFLTDATTPPTFEFNFAVSINK